VPFAYVPVRNQNLVVRGKNWRLICFVFFICFLKKGFKIKSQVANEYLFVFFDIERKKLKVELKLIWNLIKKEDKKRNHLILDQGLLWKNVFGDFCYLDIFVVFE